jgi:hypothetical protein
MTARNIAKQIVDKLFTQGATRLILARKKQGVSEEENLGGWGKEAARDEIERTLRAIARQWGS